MLTDQSPKPLYVQLSDSVAQSLIGRPEGENRLPPIRELSEQYRVSMITAIKAVDKLKSEGIIFSRPGKGLYVKDRNRLVECYAARSRTIGVVFLDIYSTSSAFLSTVVRSISDECSRLQHNLQLFSRPSDIEPERAALFWKNLRKKRLDGLILATRMPADDVRLLQEEGVPFVWIGADVRAESVYRAVTDKLHAASLILRHIGKLGHRRPAFIGADEDDEMVSYLDALCPGCGLDYSFHIAKGPETEVGYFLTESVLKTAKPDILVARGVDLTASMLSCISKLRLTMPDDVAAIGIMNRRSSVFLPANLTALISPADILAKRAVLMLQQRLEGLDPVERKTVVAEELVIRGSCGFPMSGRGEIVVSETEELERLPYPARR